MRSYIYKTDRPEYKFGYLEWKPLVKKPNPFTGIASAVKRYHEDQKAIEQSRVPVSEELYAEWQKLKRIDFTKWDFKEGYDFTLSGGVAVPVKRDIYTDESRKKKCPNCHSDKDVRLKPVTGDCMDCGATWYVGTDYDGTISRLQSELKEEKEKLERAKSLLTRTNERLDFVLRTESISEKYYSETESLIKENDETLKTL